MRKVEEREERAHQDDQFFLVSGSPKSPESDIFFCRWLSTIGYQILSRKLGLERVAQSGEEVN